MNHCFSYEIKSIYCECCVRGEKRALIPFTFPFSYSCHVIIVIVNIICGICLLLSAHPLAERRFSLSASVHFACCIGCCSGPCMDYQCNVSGRCRMVFVCHPVTFTVLLCLSSPNIQSVHFFRFLRSVDRFNDLVVSVYVTAGHILPVP